MKLLVETTKVIHNKKIFDIIEILKKTTINSDMTHKHAAAVIIGDKEFGIGYNKRIHRYYSIHAEMDAISKLPNKDIRGMDIIVIRAKNGILQNSRPCFNCINKLIKMKIRKVYYSNVDGVIVSEYAEEMEKTHVSSLDRSRNRSIN